MYVCMYVCMCIYIRSVFLLEEGYHTVTAGPRGSSLHGEPGSTEVSPMYTFHPVGQM